MENLVTAGSVKSVYQGDPVNEPVVQVLQIAEVPPTANSQQRKWRIIISDGNHFMQALLASSLSEYITGGTLVINMLIKLLSFECISVKDKKIAFLRQIDIVPFSGPLARIGKPVKIDNEAKAGSSTPEQRQSPGSSAMAVDAPNGNSYNQSTNGFMQTGSQHGNGPSYGRANGFPASNGMSDVHGPICPIKSLNPYGNRYTIRARVSAKSDIRTWHNQRGDGKLFSVNLLDDTGEIKATAFNAEVDRLYHIFEVGKIYYVSGAKVAMAKKQFSTLNNDYELTFESGSNVELCNDEDSLPTIRYSFCDLDKLVQLETNSPVDVVGVITDDGGVVEFVSKKSGAPVKKRELTIVDQSNYAVKVTLWAETAVNWDVPPSTVVAVKGARISDFNGTRSLSVSSGGSGIVASPDVPEAHRLKGWYDSRGHAADFNTSMTTPGGNISSDRATNRMTFMEAQDARLGMGEKPDYFDAKGTIAMFKKENISYTACPECRKKLVEESGSWRCEKCQRNYPDPVHRYVMSLAVCDTSGQTWLNGFDEVGQVLLGKTANEMNTYKLTNQETYNAIFDDARFKSYIFHCRAKQENFNDNERVRYTIQSATPVDFVKEGMLLAKTIEQYV